MNDTHNERELSIDTREGLEEFLRFIEDVYHDYIVAMQQRAGSEVLVSGELVTVETAHHKAKELIEHYIKVLAYGGELFPENIEELQSLYDTIATAYDSLVTPAAIPSPFASNLPEVPVKKGIDPTKERALLVRQAAEDLVYDCSELDEVKPTTPELKLGVLLYQELKAVAKRADEMVRAIEVTPMLNVPGQELLVAKGLDADLDSIEASLAQLKKSLMRFFEVEPSVTEPSSKHRTNENQQKNVKAAQLFEQKTIFSPIVETLFKDNRYEESLTEVFGSKAAFEAALKREVYKMEAPSKLDKLLGVVHESPFLFLRQMKISDIVQFDSRQPRELVREELRAKNIPYETYLAWIQALPYMQSLVPNSNTLTFIELFVRAEVELFTREREQQKNNSQGVYNS